MIAKKYYEHGAPVEHAYGWNAAVIMKGLEPSISGSEVQRLIH